jgi:DNA polymerase/3'-5' exonuclease PolX
LAVAFIKVVDGKQALKLEGVGKGTAAKIDEYITSGAIAKLEEYRASGGQ